jgi:two-component system, response regulator YesN
MMKVLVVDDEEYIRKGIISKIDWHAKGMELVAEAEDGETALDIISRQQVDLVITDICLPQKDGIELIRHVSQLGKPIKFIIISGYDKFEYARIAMKYRVTEYLLKPIKDSDLNESLDKMKVELQAQRALEQQMRDISVLHNHKQQQGRDELLNKLIDGKNTDPSDILRIQERLDLKGGERVLVSVMKVSPLLAGRPKLSDELLYFGLQNIFQEISKGSRAATVLFRNFHTRDEFVFLSFHDESPIKTKLYPLFYSFILAAREFLFLQLTIGMGDAGKSLDHASQSYVNALFAVNERILRGAGKVIDYSELPKQHHLVHVPTLGRELMLCLDERRKSEAKLHVRSWIGHIEAECYRLNHLHVQEIIIHAYMLLKKYVEDTWPGLDNGLRVKEDITLLLSQWQSLQEAGAWFEEMIENIFELPAQTCDISGKDIVELVKKYIDQHFDQDLGLQYISDTYHIHPIYFSRIFKTHVGESFNSYLTRKRMEKAMELLRNPTLKLHEISTIVGYEDPKYFSKVFKKHYGSSPSLLGSVN